MTHRRLLVMRHAKSSWQGAIDDHDRSLDPRGEKDASFMGRVLHRRGLLPELVRLSDALRTVETLAWMNHALGFELRAETRRSLYLPPVHAMLSAVEDLPDDLHTAMILSHNPSCEQLVMRLTGQSVPFTTANVGLVTWDGSWSEVGSGLARLEAVLRPKELRTLGG